MTLTALVRSDLIKKVISDGVLNNRYLQGDLPIWLELANRTKFYYIDKSLGVYRKAANSASNQLNRFRQIEFQESSKQIRIEFAERYDVPSKIMQKVQKLYFNVIMKKAYLTENKILACETLGKYKEKDTKYN